MATLPPSLPEHDRIDRLRHFERIALLLLGFGAKRSDPVQSILAHVGNFWSNAILCTLQAGPLRPSAVQKLIIALTPDHPVSRRMLTLRLRLLEEDGLIEREVHDTRSAHVEYRLTHLGRDLGERLFSIIDWGVANHREIVAARERYKPPKTPLLKRPRGWRSPPEV